MNTLNQTQKDFLKTITTVESYNELEKLFQKANKEIAGLTDDQIYCINNTVESDSSRNELIKIFREQNSTIIN